MYAVADFSKGGFGNIQEVKPFTSMAASKAFGDICRHRVRGLTKLRTQLVALERRERSDCELVQVDKKIVGPLPGDQRMMSKVQHACVEIQPAFQGPASSLRRKPEHFHVIAPSRAEWNTRVRTTYPSAPPALSPFPPFLPLLPFAHPTR
jgi:hypothetical protein